MISLLLPTRGRPALVERFFRSVVATTSQLNRVEIILYVDEDDTGSHALVGDNIKVTKIIGPRLTMGGYNMACLEKARGSIIMLANDDMVIRTRGWDEKIIELHKEFSDGIYLIYGNDLLKKQSMCTFPILSRRTCELLIEPYPKAYRGAFIDVHLLDVFKRLQLHGFNRIRYLPNIVFEHLHYRAKKAELDDTYLARSRFDDDPTFFAQANARRVGAKRLVDALQGKSGLLMERRAEIRHVPSSFMGSVKYATQELLLDRGLPWRWRGSMYAWFLARFLTRTGFFTPFLKLLAHKSVSRVKGY